MSVVIYALSSLVFLIFAGIQAFMQTGKGDFSLGLWGCFLASLLYSVLWRVELISIKVHKDG